ncbi:MAG: toprim domain-containing protein [Bacteroidota bacterium]
MNIDQAKQIPLEDVLSRQGFKPVETRKGGRELLYKSPLREEKTASFTIDRVENVWQDFGEPGRAGQQCAGGKVIDYMIHYHRLASTDAKTALDEINRLFGSIAPEPPKRPSEQFTAKENPLKLVSAKALFSPVLFQYLEDRMIDKAIARKFLKQVQYKKDEWDKPLFAAGFSNRKGGYEIRSRRGNKPFKGLVGERDITYIQGRQSGINVQVIEGFMDFLSLLTIYEKDHPQSDVIILNGSSLVQNAIELIRKHGYLNAQTWFDNDTGGHHANQALKAALHSNLQIMPQNKKYKEFNDVNEMHQHLTPEQLRTRFNMHGQ